MKLPRERFEYSAIVDRKPLALPGGARIAVWVIVNVEEWEIEGSMPRTALPAPGGVNVVPDVPNWSWHDYGMRVGFWRLKSVLDKHKIRATAAINASVCLSHPRVADAAKSAGWEFMGHGYTQKAMHLAEDQREVIRKSVDTIRRFTEKAPRGWLGPGLTESWETLDLLAEEGIEYVADWVNDDEPYEIRTRTRPLVAVPYTLETNDITVIAIQHCEAHEFYSRARDQFERLYREGRHRAKIMAIALHPYISGVPHRIKYFERICEHLKKRSKVLFWTGEEILDWYRQVTCF